MSDTELHKNGTGDDYARIVAELKDKHGDVYEFRAADQRVICRLPTPDEYDKWKDECEKEKNRKPITATELIFRQTCVWPPKPEMIAMLAKRRGLAITFGNQILEKAGITESVVAEKL